MNWKHLTLAPVLMTVAVGCGQPSTQQATADFCKNLAGLQQELATLKNLKPTSTVGELNQTRDRIQLAFDKLTRSETVLKDARLDDLKKAEDNFKKTVNGISKKDTLAEAATQVQQAGAQVEAARAQVSSAVQCP